MLSGVGAVCWVRRLCVVALLAGAALAPIATAAPPRVPPVFGYALMPDGVRLAVVTTFPRGYVPGRARWPALFEMDGYEGGAGPVDPSYWGDRYVVVHASIRGTGCSGGRFDLFDGQTARDGRYLIDGWMSHQPWSNGRVGIVGHSYPGLTGFAVAETNPRHLVAVAVSGLVDDLYRGLAYLGGVPDGGFPVAWPLLLRPAQEYDGNLSRYGSDQPSCATALTGRQAPAPLDDPALNGAIGREDGVWWQAHSLITGIAGIRRPVHVVSTYQDEQTGPRGGVELWRHLPPDVPKRIVLTNGVHATHEVAHADEVAWLDCWLLHDGRGCPGGISDPKRRVQIRFDTTGPGNNPFADKTNPPYEAADYPLPQSAWSRLYLHGAGTLSTTAPKATEPGRTFVALPVGRSAYLSGAGVADSTGDAFERLVDSAYRDGYGQLTTATGPDAVSWRLPVSRPLTIAGPLEADLWMTSTAPDTDVFVEVMDVGRDGSVSMLQRGLLRASFRAVDRSRSELVATGGHRGELLVPFHPFVNPTLLTPGAATLLRVEIFPLGHVFRAGHSLVVAVTSPPVMDELNGYASLQPPAVDTILSGPGHASSLLVPFLPVAPQVLRSAPACGDLTGVRCATPVR